MNISNTKHSESSEPNPFLTHCVLNEKRRSKGQKIIPWNYYVSKKNL